MKKLLTILLVLVTVSGFAGKLNEGYDPIAAHTGSDAVFNSILTAYSAYFGPYGSGFNNAGSLVMKNQNAIAIENDTASSAKTVARMVGDQMEIGQAGEVLKFPGTVLHAAASSGYTIYQGNTAVSATGEASKQLPLNGTATSLTLASGTCGYAVAEVTGKLESTNSMCHVRLSWSFENLDNTYSIVGNPASTTDQLNAATWSVSLGSDGNLYASGTPDALWQVKRFEIGGL